MVTNHRRITGESVVSFILPSMSDATSVQIEVPGPNSITDPGTPRVGGGETAIVAELTDLSRHSNDGGTHEV